EILAMMPRSGNAFDLLAGMLAGAVSSLVAGIGKAVSGAAEAVGGFFSGVGRALFKRKDGRTGAEKDPDQIRSQMGGGRQLDGSVSSRMGAAFGHDFSHVRVHTDPKAAGLSDNLNARAFTIGGDIAFATGEYQPGTLIGDALIAHELAHVVQQQGSSQTEVSSLEAGDGAVEFYEREADAAAAEVLASLHGGMQLRRPRASALGAPRLQSCGASLPPQIRVPFGSSVTEEQADKLLADDPLIAPRIKARVQAGRVATGHTHELGSEDYLYTALERVY